VPVVVKPMMCMVGCTTCATICTRDAIEFPATGYIRQLIRDEKLLRQSKDMLAPTARSMTWRKANRPCKDWTNLQDWSNLIDRSKL
jgi:ferredoxin